MTQNALVTKVCCLIEARIRTLTQVDQKGDRVFVNPHETLGKITEEYHELIEAIHKDDIDGTVAELYDIAVLAVWGIVSANKEKVTR